MNMYFVAFVGGLLQAPMILAEPTTTTPQSLYGKQCTPCHALTYNKLGPAHQGVVGRAIGKYPGFDYSRTLRTASGVWTPENLDLWLADPEKFLPGQHMGVSVPDAQERALIIEHLKKL